MEDLTHRVLSQNSEPSPQAAQFFNLWMRNDPAGFTAEVQQHGASLDNLLKGEVQETARFLTGKENPRQDIINRLTDPRVLHRIVRSKGLAHEIRDEYVRNGYERLVSLVEIADVQHSGENYRNATSKVLHFFGFIEVAEQWYTNLGIMRTPVDPEFIFDTSLQLPYDYYTLEVKHTRGLDIATTFVHYKTLPDLRADKLDGRSLIAGDIAKLPTLLFEGLKARFPPNFEYTKEMKTLWVPGELRIKPQKRDPLGLAFQHGYRIDLGEGKFAYHPRLLLEHLHGNLNEKAHAYFFMKAMATPVHRIDRPDLDAQEADALEQIVENQTPAILPGKRTRPIGHTFNVRIDFTRNVDTDISMYRSILETDNAQRLFDVKSLGNCNHDQFMYAIQTRQEHMIGVMHMARVLCNRFGIRGKDKILVETYALVHDWGHLTGSHATEEHFKPHGFDHEEFAKRIIRKNAAAFEGLCSIEDLIAMFEHKNPLHDIVDGPFGADRIYYLCVDPNEYGLENQYDPMRILTWLNWSGKEVIVDQNHEEAFNFLNNRAAQYQRIYYNSRTQTADAYQGKMLRKAGITDHETPIELYHSKFSPAGIPFGTKIPFWTFNDTLFQYQLSNHPNQEVREIMRHLLLVYHKAPHSTVTCLRLPGHTKDEQPAEIPFYHELTYNHVEPLVEETDPKLLAHYHKQWKKPERVTALETEIAKRSIHIPERHVIVASVPSLAKLASEHAPVRIGNEIKSLFDWHPEYKQPFLDRAAQMTCMRVAVHPQLYTFAYDFFKKQPFSKIIEEVYGTPQ